MSKADRRIHFRFKDPKTTTLRFVLKRGETESAVTALVVDESHTGLACVYVGEAVDADTEIFWQETKHIKTPCKVMRCENLYRGVFLLALQFVS